MGEWNDGISDAEFCTSLFGENWEMLEPDFDFPELTSEEIDKLENELWDGHLVYLLFTPRTFTAKVGMAKNRNCLKKRIKERQRQCGNTQLVGVFLPSKDTLKSCREEESFLLCWFRDHPYIKAISTEVFIVEDPSWINFLFQRSNAYWSEDFESLTWGDL